MDSSSSPDFVTEPAPNQIIKPLILASNHELNLNPPEVNDRHAEYPSPQLGPIITNINETQKQEVVEDKKYMVSTVAYHTPGEEDGEQLWPKITELDDRPSSPNSQSIAIKQVISECANDKRADKFDDDDRPQSPDVDESKPTAQMNLISKVTYQSSKQEFESNHSIMKNPKLHIVIREGAYQEASEGMLADDVLSLSSSSPNDMARRAYQVSPLLEPQHAAVKESYRTSAQGRLSSVVEESESFSRREFGDNIMQNYMSTFSSAAHASYLASLRAKDGTAFDYKQVSYRQYSNYHHFTYNLSTSYDPNVNFANSKSAPAGTATRTGSAFGLFRRGRSERSGLKIGRRPVYRGARQPRKPKTLVSTLLWPLLKIRNGYVGCMMGLEGTGDLTAMSQGGSYATTARYFADVPLSKSDSTNYG